MQHSTHRILTTHVGSLPRPESLVTLYRQCASVDALAPALKSAVGDVVRRQREAGVDVVNDGEFGKATKSDVDYGAWWSYVYERLDGFEPREGAALGRNYGPTRSKDRRRFSAFYQSGMPLAGGTAAKTEQASATERLAGLACTRPIRYVGDQLIRRDAAHLKAALNGRGEDAFMSAVSPATLQILRNEYYSTPEEYTWALADAMHEEYRAIVDAGFLLQIDDPALVDLYDWWFSEGDDLASYRKWAVFQVEALNHALRGIPEDRVRFHICWGSWHGPHSADLELKDVADLLVTINAQAYSIEAGNVRHAHEWKVWRDVVRLPAGKMLIPGVVSHATNVLEHPELVADRIIQYADVVGREHVIAGTDCGLGGRIHPDLAWAKLEVLAEGAALASSRLWP
ncbi:MAG: cobalamin-independent methionine synthase II family protein [Acidobacteriota bacterium]